MGNEIERTIEINTKSRDFEEIDEYIIKKIFINLFGDKPNEKKNYKIIITRRDT